MTGHPWILFCFFWENFWFLVLKIADVSYYICIKWLQCCWLEWAVSHWHSLIPDSTLLWRKRVWWLLSNLLAVPGQQSPVWTSQLNSAMSWHKPMKSCKPCNQHQIRYCWLRVKELVCKLMLVHAVLCSSVDHRCTQSLYKKSWCILLLITWLPCCGLEWAVSRHIVSCPDPTLSWGKGSGDCCVLGTAVLSLEKPMK